MSRHQHYWVDQHEPHELVYLNNKWLYECSVCDKRKYIKGLNAPMNPIVPSAWEVYERSDKALTLSPPMIMLGREPDYVEGERYKRLIKGDSHEHSL